MRRWPLRLWLAALLLAGAAGPGQAAEAVTPRRIVAPDCAVDFASAVADRGRGGRTHGFVAFTGEGCDPDERVVYVEGAGVRWSPPEVTPYRGVVLAAASDEGGTWLLYRAVSGIWLGRRTGPGVYTRPRHLSGFRRPQGIVHTGDLVADGGRWWAVWTEQVGPGGDHAQTELFEAGTLTGDPVGRRPVTRHPALDAEPSLALSPDGGTLTLAWVRRRGGATTSQLRLAQATAGGRWASRPVSRPGTLNLSPTVGVTTAGVTLAWQQDTAVMLVTPASPVPLRVPATPGVLPRVTPAGDEDGLWLGWTVPGAHGRALVAARRDGSWVERLVAPELDADQTLITVTGREGGGTATALVLTSSGELFAAAL